MPILRAEENRYLLIVEPALAHVAPALPGARWNASLSCWTLGRKPAAIYALDRLFGASGWLAEGQAAFEAQAARAVQRDPPSGRASVELRGGRLAVECGVPDKELVKRVPGYSWSPADKRWFVDALPLSIELLEEGFGDRLSVDIEAQTFVDLKRRDQQAREERADSRRHGGRSVRSDPAESRTAGSATPRHEAPAADEAKSHSTDRDAVPIAGETGPAPEEPAEGTEAIVPQDPLALLAEQVGRLADVMARLERRLGFMEEGGGRVAVPVGGDAPLDGEESADDWDDLLRLTANDPDEALARAEARLQTTSGEPGPLRGIAGIAAARVGLRAPGDARVLDVAHRRLRLALGSSEPLPADVEREALDSYQQVVLALIGSRCGPEHAQATASVDDLQAALLAELTDDDGFDDETIGSAESQAFLALLTMDQALAERLPRLSELCRLLHLVATDRGHSPSASEQAEELLLGSRLSDAGFALGAVLLANRLSGAACQSRWLDGWPAEELRRKGADLTVLASRSGAIGTQPAGLRAAGALSVLGMLSAVSAEQVPFAIRRQLLALIPKTHPRRDVAEFLAVMPFAEGGDPFDRACEKGYLRIVERTPLALSKGHLELVDLHAPPGAALMRELPDPVATAVARSGFRHPGEEAPFFLVFAANHADRGRLLLPITQALEDCEFPGERVAPQLVGDIYREAFDGLLATRRSEVTEAFLRLARFMNHERALEQLTALAIEQTASPVAALRVPALLVHLDLLLNGGASSADIAATIEKFRDQRKKDPLAPELVAECRCLAEIFPAEANVFLGLLPPGTAAEAAPAFPGKRVLVVGGHQQMKARGEPLLEKMEIDVDWQDATEAKNGKQVIDLARGAADLVVINTAYIGHAASGRVRVAAENEGKRVEVNGSNGLGALCATVRHALEEIQGHEGGAHPPRHRAEVRRRMLR